MTPRGHRLLPHTADTGLEAHGPDLATTFEEAGLALAGLTADIAPEALLRRGGDEGGSAVIEEAVPTDAAVAAQAALPPLARVRLEARDLAALAFAWLDELIGRVDMDGALAAIEVEAVVERPAGYEGGLGEESSEAAWELRARMATLPFDGVQVRRRTDVKAVTYHGLEVVPEPGGWRLTAYLDI